MDPNSVLIALLESIEDNEHQDAIVHLNDLMMWIKRGGFPPNCQAAIETLRERMRDNASGGIRETTEQTMIAAHKAGIAYWQRNKPDYTVTRPFLESLARSCGWHGEDCIAWLAGYYGQRKRDTGIKAPSPND